MQFCNSMYQFYFCGVHFGYASTEFEDQFLLTPFRSYESNRLKPSNKELSCYVFLIS